MKRPSLSPLRLFEPATPFPQLAGATAGGSMLFAQNSGGSGSGGNGGSRRPDDVDPEYDEFDEGTYDVDDEAPAAAPRGGRRGSTGRQGGSAGGRQRTVQFQPEERYWTEYLRIALPVIGLLLMLGLFWFWAQQLIDNGDNKEPQATDVPGVVVTQTEQANVPTATTAVIATVAPTQPPSPTEPPAEPTATTATENQATPPSTGQIEIGGTVTTNDADINMRLDATTSGEIVTTLAQGESLTVIDGPVEADGHTWWQVEDGSGNSGWVVADYLTPSE
ncbi:MAG: SH3 domain-containing protein [Thermomicrobiales bacterium]